jgi:NAD(P)-dependent dehydrogenase (short-subunit alcohol dehydrogenase family)
MLNKKKILIFGASGFIATKFISSYSNEYEIIKVGRNPKDDTWLKLDFDHFEDDLEEIVSKIQYDLDGVVFLQGLNPSNGFKEISVVQFNKMININITVPSMIIQKIHTALNPGASVVFFSSIATKKGSYDPSYAAAKSGIKGLILSLSNALPIIRFNSISLGLVEDSPVAKGMTTEFKNMHSERMFENKLIRRDNVVAMIHEVINNPSIHRTDINLDGGYK